MIVRFHHSLHLVEISPHLSSSLSLLFPLPPSLPSSDEEIDVVTVPSSERTRLARKRSHPLSAPCSRQPSPHPPPKRRKYHTKRLQRLSSAGSSGCDIAESDDEARRASHNVLERKRRNDLKSSFQVCLLSPLKPSCGPPLVLATLIRTFLNQNALAPVRKLLDYFLLSFSLSPSLSHLCLPSLPSPSPFSPIPLSPISLSLFLPSPSPPTEVT